MNHLVDGVSSAARTLAALDGRDLTIVRSAGPYLFGDDGERYVDTALGFGATILGHAHPAVIAATVEALQNGPLPAFRHPGEERAAAALARHMAPLDKAIFANSGSEAVHLAARIARLLTGRTRIAKMAAGFDGWLDEIALGNVGSPEAAFHDQRRPTNEKVTLLRFNDFDDVERLFADNDDIAAVLYEPILANAACLMPAPGYLEHVQEVARHHGALLIADEVLMGFRLHAGLASHFFGLDPDIATIGKAIGSGVPAAGVVARGAMMDDFIARGGLRGGTYSGNPLACAAIEATLGVLADADYARLHQTGDDLRAFVTDSFAAAGMHVATSGFGTVFSTWFAAQAPGDYESANRLADAALSRQLHMELRRRGVLVMPSPYGRIYTSFAHDDEALAIMRDAIVGAADAMASPGRGRAVA